MSMLCARATRAKRSNSSNVPLLPSRAGREGWLRQREQRGSSLTLEEIRAKSREDWLKLRRQRTRENSRDTQDRSAEKDQDAKPNDLSGNPDEAGVPYTGFAEGGYRGT
jgi:hypothetical protein